MARPLRAAPVIESPVATRLIQVRQKFWPESQKKMAAALGCDTANVSNMLAGRQGPSLKTLTALAEYVDINWLLTGKGKQP